MDDFRDELEATRKVYDVLAPLGLAAFSRITGHVSLRLSKEAEEREKEERERREREPTPMTRKLAQGNVA